MRSWLASTVMLALCSCGAVKSGGDDFFRVVRGEADDIEKLGDSRWVPSGAPPLTGVTPTQDDIIRSAEAIAQPAQEIPVESQKEVVDAVCQGVDAAEAAAGDAADAVEYAITRTESAYSYRFQAQELAENLMYAGNSLDQAAILGRAAVCLAASS